MRYLRIFMFNFINYISMNSYVLYEEALRQGIEFRASKVDVDNYANDEVKKNVIEAIKDGSWVDKFCYEGHIVWFERLENVFSLDKGFLFEDFYANETFVMFVEFSSLADWVKFIDVRLKVHVRATKSLSEFYEVMRRYKGFLSKDVADNSRLTFSYYILHPRSIEYLIESGDLDKINEFVSNVEFAEAYNLHAVVRFKLDNLFLRFIDRDDFGKFFDFWISLIKRDEFNTFRLEADVRKLFSKKHPSEYAIYQNLLNESL